MTVRCPICRKETKYSPENPFRPFCSERCQLTDLGQWAEGKYAIPVKLNNEDIDAEIEPETDSDENPLD
jgi:endogenous inhibitor of DNA gyrase (YacG/DUF329 family)